jgi:6-phospho-beta-glucosidase
MARDLTLSLIGAGSSYTPELIHAILQQTPEELPIARLQLTDINPERLAIMAGFAERALRHGGRDITVTSDVRLRPMLEGADFVITQLRVGGMAARHLDESIPLKYGIVGQETTGPGGMCKALRTIPPMLEIGRAVGEVCPDAFLLNYTNPSGIITEAVSKHTPAKIIGLCSGLPGIQRRLRERFADTYPDLTTYTAGLNHFGWVCRMLSGGRDVTAEVIAQLAEQDCAEGNATAARWESLVGAVPISYVRYFFHHRAVVEEMQDKDTTRAQDIEGIEHAILEEAANPETVTKPTALAQRGGGGYAGVTFTALKAILRDTGEEMTANVPNRGAVQAIDDDAVVEVSCRLDRTGAHPLPVGPLPLAYRGLVLALKAYETLTVEAAVHRSRRLATLALLSHPLCGDLDVIEPMLDELLTAHGLEYA